MPKQATRLLFLLFSLTISLGVSANTMSVIDDYIKEPEKVGEGRLTFMFWQVYDASLFAEDGEWQENKPFALSLKYLRELDGDKIADRSIEEIRRQGFNDELKMAAWHQLLIQIFPDVKDGSVLTGVLTEDKRTVFYLADNRIGEITDPEFGQHFFNIWLGSNTSQPQLRHKLLSIP
jgi:hypothetical protein